MNQTYKTRPLYALIMLPFLMNSITPVLGAEALNKLALNDTEMVDPLEAQKKLEAAKIDAYYADRNMPLAGLGEVFVREAYANDIDPFLLAAIGVRESTGGRHACKKATYSAFGWGSCKINFKSYEDSIAIISKHLGGNHEKTARYYSLKDTKAILQTYNPPHIVAHYAQEVMNVMGDMEHYDVS